MKILADLLIYAKRKIERLGKNAVTEQVSRSDAIQLFVVIISEPIFTNDEALLSRKFMRERAAGMRRAMSIFAKTRMKWIERLRRTSQVKSKLGKENGVRVCSQADEVRHCMQQAEKSLLYTEQGHA